MMVFLNELKGIHYRNPQVYDFLTVLKLGMAQAARFRIAAQLINPAESVLDLCSGGGTLKDFLPSGCRYTAVDASPEFISYLKRKNIPSFQEDLHRGFEPKEEYARPDVIVMIISLCHFKKTSVHQLLESFKKNAKRVIIVEDVLEVSRHPGALRQRMMRFLCSRPYCENLELYTAREFQNVMRRHKYQCWHQQGPYYVGYYTH